MKTVFPPLVALVLIGSALLAHGAGTSLKPLPNAPMAPAFELDGPDGNTYRLEDLLGRPIVVNFWATWCPPCRAEMPSMQRAWEQLRDEDILFLAINVGEDARAIERFLKEVPVSFPLPMDVDSNVAQSWPMRGLPTTFVVDPRGRLVYEAAGELDWDDPGLRDLVRALKVAPGSTGQPPSDAVEPGPDDANARQASQQPSVSAASSAAADPD